MKQLTLIPVDRSKIDEATKARGRRGIEAARAALRANAPADTGKKAA